MTTNQNLHLPVATGETVSAALIGADGLVRFDLRTIHGDVLHVVAESQQSHLTAESLPEGTPVKLSGIISGDTLTMEARRIVILSLD